MSERGIGGRPVQKEKKVSMWEGRVLMKVHRLPWAALMRGRGVVSDGVAWEEPGFEAPRGGSSERVGFSASPGRWSKSKTRRSVGAGCGLQEKSERGSRVKWKGHRVARYRVQGGVLRRDMRVGLWALGWSQSWGSRPRGNRQYLDGKWVGGKLARNTEKAGLPCPGNIPAQQAEISMVSLLDAGMKYFLRAETQQAGKPTLSVSFPRGRRHWPLSFWTPRPGSCFACIYPRLGTIMQTKAYTIICTLDTDK